MMFNSENDNLKNFFNFTPSPASAWYVIKRLLVHLTHLARYGRGVLLTSGNALAARLAASAFDLGIPIWTDAPALKLLIENHAVKGAEVRRGQRIVRIRARYGVVLAAGGYPHDLTMRAKDYPHVARGDKHISPPQVG